VLDTPNYTPQQMRGLRRAFHAMNRFMVWLWKLGLGPLLNSWPAVGGRMLVIEHRGRKSGKRYLTPVNYVLVEGEVYCTAGFGPGCDWYRNIMAEPRVRLWLPQGWRAAQAADESDSPRRVQLLRQVIIASGFAGPLLGVDPHKYSDEQLTDVAKDYRLVRFSLETPNAVSGV
jgi:deazaflavin-dependent oxidoreductase (nitroreductase family)